MRMILMTLIFNLIKMTLNRMILMQHKFLDLRYANCCPSTQCIQVVQWTCRPQIDLNSDSTSCIIHNYKGPTHNVGGRCHSFPPPGGPQCSNGNATAKTSSESKGQLNSKTPIQP